MRYRPRKGYDGLIANRMAWKSGNLFNVRQNKSKIWTLKNMLSLPSNSPSALLQQSKAISHKCERSGCGLLTRMAFISLLIKQKQSTDNS